MYIPNLFDGKERCEITLRNDLNKYNNTHDETGILTIYLNTDLGEGNQQSGEWKIRLKNGLKKLKEYTESSGSKDEQKAYKKLADEANQRIYDLQTDMQKALIFIASADGELRAEYILQVPVETEFHWEKKPIVTQLQDMESKFPPAGIIMVQQRDVILMDTALGEINEEKRFSWEFESEDWKQYKGNASSDRTSSGTTQVDEVQQRFDENRLRWYKSLAPMLDKEIKKRGLQGAYLVGNKEAVRDLEKHLGTKILDVIPKNLISKPSHEILNHVYGESVR
ncbi:VLRF1 family aeRF1-type release factor [Alteribacillus sp. HJP-4]|uniref:VLRF1 family aeRF1-type release factor n=1 Tax=Alteribacillus sp. HJP-4 TaxID=2775394 RepID=UPI0035CD1519